jgi:hypothetical protein
MAPHRCLPKLDLAADVASTNHRVANHQRGPRSPYIVATYVEQTCEDPGGLGKPQGLNLSVPRLPLDMTMA